MDTSNPSICLSLGVHNKGEYVEQNRKFSCSGLKNISYALPALLLLCCCVFVFLYYLFLERVDGLFKTKKEPSNFSFIYKFSDKEC